MGTELCLENLKRKDILGGLGVDESILNYDVRYLTGFI
jgi:hypothetical protein